MTGYIYLIRNLVNGKGYVGQTVSSVSRRFTQHKIDARNGADYLLYRAMRKYGVENFTVRAIVSCEDGDFLNELEQHYIRFFGTFKATGHGYNSTQGGDGSAGAVVSDFTKAKMTAAKLGKKRPPFSEEHRRKMSLAKKGNTNGRGGKGRIPTEATKAKISKSRKLHFERKASSTIIVR